MAKQDVNGRKKVFIDGQHGTVGLQIRERLKNRPEIEIIEIETEKRKDPARKKELLNQADFVFLCLPDQAARDSVALIDNPKVVVFDGSTAHRTHPDWVYGIPELNPVQRTKISESKRISVPGCYATGFSLMVHPLTGSKILPTDYPVTTYAITGYSGGGRPMIEEYEANKDNETYGARPKNLNLNHKHLPEMQTYGLLDSPPIFTPIVGQFSRGMLVFLPIAKRGTGHSELTQDFLIDFYTNYYKNEPLINVVSRQEIDKIDADFLDPTTNNGTNKVDLFVFGQEDRFLVVTRFDNLGKGASGAAVQNLNIQLGADEFTCLDL